MQGDAGDPGTDAAAEGGSHERSPDASTEPDATTASALAIALGGTPSPCTGQTSEISFTASGGTPPYAWSLDGAGRWSLDASSGASVSASGTPTGAGQASLSVTVTDSAHAIAHRTFAVSAFEPPRVTPSLPPACAGYDYVAPLTATGGDPASYRWSANQGDGGVVTLEGGNVSFSPTATGAVSFVTTVSDEHCTSSPVEITIPIDANCPTIDPETLPAPCIGAPYPPQSFTVKGGTPPYTWTAPSLPAGLSFDDTQLTVSGGSDVSGTFVLQVTDGSGHRVQRTYPLTPRAECWFSYIRTSGTPALHFVDPLLGTTLNFPHSAGVTDFKFSPDGNYLAYRATVQAASHLFVAVGPSWTDAPVDLGDTVDRYSWSPDSKTLAVGFEAASVGYLGGVRVSKGAPASGSTDASTVTAGDGGVAASVATLTPSTVQVDSDIVWVDDARVAFLVPSPQPGNDEVYAANLGNNGFSGVAAIDSATQFDATSTLLANSIGVFVLDPSFQDLGFYGSFLSPVFPLDFGDAVPDPEERYVATTNSGQLQIFQTVQHGDRTPWATSQNGCEALLAWAPGAERIACTNDSLPTDKATIFDIDATSPVLTPAPVYGTGSYTVGASTTHRRAFSSSGNWFAFSSPTGLGLASLADGTPHVVQTPSPPQGTPVDRTDELLYSPDEKRILWKVGSGLELAELSAKSQAVQLDDALSPAPPCTEDLVTAPATWCGRNSPVSGLAWSPDSRFAAIQLASGTIEVKDLLDLEIAIHTLDACTNECGNDFAFQP